jgi:hypothetical protein
MDQTEWTTFLTVGVVGRYRRSFSALRAFIADQVLES